jgi:hypothetical protein
LVDPPFIHLLSTRNSRAPDSESRLGRHLDNLSSPDRNV